MNLSYWEYKTWLSNIDFTIVGSGIVGLNCAMSLRIKYPKARILILEKGILPQGASTKNAGFACFGSLSEILSDLKINTPEEVVDLVQKRLDGIKALRENLGDTNIGYQQLGGHELFLEKDMELYDISMSKIEEINEVLFPVFKDNAFSVSRNIFNFLNINEKYITHKFEGQINTGSMMQSLLSKVLQSNITILNGITVEQFAENREHVEVKTNRFHFKTKQLFIATNGFSASLVKEKVRPARAQVLITRPIKNLHIKGTFHLEEGFYYFRNIEDRILLGGGRNLDFKGEETTDFGSTAIIQEKLETLLRETVLPRNSFEIDQRWSGIMGVGSVKKPIIKAVSSRVYCGVRLGGMGVAIGSFVGKELASMYSKS
ncbi:FAD-dependent oxidoreductase [uncultured Maribacter sp.]|uniref:NAD(P)/FAD-dependent oxidoreductase n=1 Tax=uncultured Maribacter sp. TaxID=431308 RepID=UPI002603D535|nr:FAD-dependent oxidoreductase [uncultured Maribacter sp.]